MSAVVRRALPTLKLLAGATPKLKKAIIQHASPDVVKAIAEIVLSMIKGVLKLSPQQKQRLSRYKKQLLSSKKRCVCSKEKKTSTSKRRWCRSCNITTYCNCLVIKVNVKLLSK